ncbi:16S rRNA (guanine(966)-N(2))-methyltransferase RsmD [Lactobacillus sp. S2-2]|uniref:16S rRNA (guanine(966)-N(2))-methyltransferase RsmD n=1 Tax=Lactobacillus sp. S2-2 TaxID=2692917 RepID=UPI001F0015B7|nr:16S rRNA (guanine(966)-N(2))-methyltransferase RsmD [Lactobacillus sp. S2-2]MCF6514886.1 16S rRNA (guanine(966)-N(2))-methyltransferase RsmD [Lactobacillus sp. S2-2]
MRVISGKFGGRKLKPVSGKQTRPTTDKVRGALFNMIGPYFESKNHFLDLYAGSGAVAIEAISRGMGKATLVDKSYLAIKSINENIQIDQNYNEHFEILKLDSKQALKKFSQNNEKFDYVFLDPPYQKQKMVEELNNLYSLKLLNQNAYVICETDNQVNLKDDIEHFELVKQKDYGLTIVSIYQLK